MLKPDKSFLGKEKKGVYLRTIKIALTREDGLKMTAKRTHSSLFGYAARLVLSLLAVVCSAVAAQATPQEFVVRFHFRLDYATYENRYMDNDRVADSLARFLGSIREDQIVDVKFVSYASPEGILPHNIELCEARNNTMKEVLAKRFPQFSGKTSYEPGGEAWELVRQRVKADTNMQTRSPETYQIINDILNDSTIGNDQKKVLLKSRLKENWYGYLRWIHYREARICEVRVRYNTEDVEEEVVAEVEPVVTPDVETVVLHDTVYIYKTDTVYVEQPVVREETRTKKTIVAVKSNLLFDAASMLNYAIEVPIGNRFSLVWEHYFPWWVFPSNRICVQYLTLGGEARWWFAPMPRPATEKRALRDRLVGHYFGLYGFWGKTDLQWDKFGCYQCDNVISAGLTYGFVFPVSRHLNMELSLSVGYARIPYQHYLPSEDWQTLWRDYDDNGLLHYIGPTKLQVSLVWPIQITTRQNHSAREGAAR